MCDLLSNLTQTTTERASGERRKKGGDPSVAMNKWQSRWQLSAQCITVAQLRAEQALGAMGDPEFFKMSQECGVVDLSCEVNFCVFKGSPLGVAPLGDVGLVSSPRGSHSLANVSVLPPFSCTD